MHYTQRTLTGISKPFVILNNDIKACSPLSAVVLVVLLNVPEI